MTRLEEWEIIVAQKRIDSEFWIDPDGNIHKCKTVEETKDWASLHECIAEYTFPHDGHLGYVGRTEKSAGDKLFDLGWMMVGSCWRPPIVKNDVTQAQINCLDKLGYVHFDIKTSDGAGNLINSYRIGE